MSGDSTNSLDNKKPVTAKVKLWLRKKFNREVGEELQNIIENRESDSEELSEHEKEMLASTLRFTSLEADDVSVPRSEVAYVAIKCGLDELLQTFNKSGFSRLLVCRENLDEVLGFVTLKDIVEFVGKENEFTLKRVMHPCTFVPDSLPLPSVLSTMQKNRVQIAVVVDEYGGTSGLVSVMDILECLVGDVDDEHDDVTPAMVIPLRGGNFQIDARAPIDALEDKIKIKMALFEIGETDYDTVAGYVINLAGHVPVAGEEIALDNGNYIRVDIADGRRVQKVTLIKHL